MSKGVGGQLADALWFARTARDGVTEEGAEAFSDMLLTYDVVELRNLVMASAILLDLAIKADSWAHFEKLAANIRENGDWW